MSKLVYRYIDSPLGSLIIGTTSKGCCLLEFDDRYSLTDINSRYNKWYKVDCIEGIHSTLDTLENELKDYFNGKLRDFSIPLDLRGTPFETTVWNELQKIPYGETRSYNDIAKAIGNPSASRAVGRANGNNPVAIVVPCHRVIASNGKLHGYGGGLWRKEKLLALELRKKKLTDFM
ncbi:MAG: methylated-DNA--[protein]-cysteine S-methyltransferase [Candidatus Heimdallarchaeota archaeon]|nr:MAG: methylated-DNA--[protein]-cysteine S-methyltransferase [Candidatus Heimdallarchaeota archaeon]